MKYSLVIFLDLRKKPLTWDRHSHGVLCLGWRAVERGRVFEPQTETWSHAGSFIHSTGNRGPFFLRLQVRCGPITHGSGQVEGSNL